MRKSILFLTAAIACCNYVYSQGHRQCGFGARQHYLEEKHPEYRQFIAERKTQWTAISEKAESAIPMANKTTATIYPIPVVFHIVVDSGRFNQLGGVAGIKRRVDSQIIVLNRDYNRQNPDSSQIPSGYKSLYTTVGIQFGLAHTDPRGNASPGYDIRITSKAFTQGSDYEYGDVKDSATGGITAWNPDKYLNVWCLYFSDNPTLLGITTDYSMTSSAGGPWALPKGRRGICITYNSLGKRTTFSDSYASSVFDKGRTLVHECGHYFGLFHTWGDDGGLCPWSSGGADDGISDTPPESDATYGAPTYSITGGTLYDGCKYNGSTLMQSIGIPCLDYMDYTDDGAMHMFTKGQANVMKTTTLVSSGENYTLTQNPTLLAYPTGVQELSDVENRVIIFPNPAHTTITVSTEANLANELKDIKMYNTLGQEVYSNNAIDNGAIVTVNTDGMSRGIYFIHCNFASGRVIRKIVLQ